MEDFTTMAAAEYLGLSQKTVSRYKKKGLLEATGGNGGHSRITELSVLTLREMLKAKEFYGSEIRQIFMLNKGGWDYHKLGNTFGNTENSIDLALRIYEFERESRFSFYGFDSEPEKKDSLFVQEAMSKLRVSDPRVIKKLVEDGFLKDYKIRIGKQEFSLISLESMKEYLGDIWPERLYNSREVSFSIMKDVKTIDAIARQNNIGRKINPNDNNNRSQYIFTNYDKDLLSILKRDMPKKRRNIIISRIKKRWER